MNFYDFIIQNKDLMKLFYGFIISLICLIIVLKSDRLFHISMHKGIRYFRNAFFFYGIAFIIRYVFWTPFFLPYLPIIYYFRIQFLFEFFLIMAGFFLFYSLLWKRIESYKVQYPSSLFNAYILIFYAMAFIISFLDYLFDTYYLLFYSQIVLFIFISLISYNNYIKKPNAKFLKFYFIAMIIGLMTWLLNAITGLYLFWNVSAIILIYSLNMIVFLLFLFGVIKITNSK